MKYLELKFDESWLRRRSGDPDYHTGFLREFATEFRIVEHGDWHRYPYHEPLENGRFGLAFEGLDRSSTGSSSGGKDRVELTISSPTMTGPLKIGRRRYLFLRAKIDPISQSPVAWTILAQVHQATSHGEEPPLALHCTAIDGTSATLELRARSDTHLRGGSQDYRVVWTGLIPLDEFVDFRFQLEPIGQVALAINDEVVVVDKGGWGYTPGTRSFGEIEDSFSVRAGIYRGKQARRLKLVLDQVIWASTAKSSMPDDPSPPLPVDPVPKPVPPPPPPGTGPGTETGP